MRKIKLNFCPSERITSLDGSINRTVTNSENIRSVLKELFPRKKGFFFEKNEKSLIISFDQYVPFGPSAKILADYFLKNINDDLEFIKKFYKLDKIYLSGISRDDVGDVKYLSFLKKEKRRDLIINPYEAKKILDIARNGITSDDIIFSIFIKPGQVYTYIIPNKINFSFLFSSIAELSDFSIDEFIDTVNGGSLSNETIIASTPVRHISPSNWRIENFPYSLKPVQMVYCKNKNPDPCCNCLSCAAVCPAGLYPSLLYHHLIKDNLNESTSLGLNLCSLCGGCSVICPSGLALSDSIFKGLLLNSGEIS